MFKRWIIIVFAMTMLAVIFTGHVWAVTTGISNGVYDFGDLGANDSLGPGTGYARLGDKFKVGNDEFVGWYSLNVPSPVETALNPLSFDTSLYTAVIKAEGGTTCKTFTFKDMGISFYNNSQKFGSLAIKLFRPDGSQIGSTASLGSTPVYSMTDVTQISAISALPAPWPVDGVALIEIAFTIKNADGSDAKVSDLNFENITIANVDAIASSKPSVFGVSPSSGPVSGGTLVTITGADFTGVTNVLFGSASPVISNVVSSTQLTAITPEFSTPSTVNITVATPSDTSNISASEPVQFTFRADGTYDFGSLGVADSAEIGYARLGDKFKVENYLFAKWRSFNTGPYTAIYPDSSITSPNTYTAIIKAEGGATCNTFTFKDMGISATLDLQKFDAFDLVLKDISGAQIGSTISLGSSPVYSKTSVVNISNLYSQDPWSVDDVAAIEITYSISANATPAKAWDLTLENITVANIKGKSSQTITFGPVPTIDPGTGTGTVSAVSFSGLTPTGLPITFVSTTTDVCTVTGTTVTIITGGDCIITASQDGNASFLAAPKVKQNFSKTNQKITFGAPPSVIVKGTGTVLAETDSSGLNSIIFSSGTKDVCTVNVGTTTVIGVKTGSCIIYANQADDSNHNAAPQETQIFNVGKGTPTITWSYPVDITYGTALSATQLNATANVAGTFAYTPAFGTTLNAGAGQTLSVSFVPTDTTNYNTPVTSAVAITVTKATPTITWPNPADITYGTALNATQLNATANVAGTFAYTPASSTILNAGAGQVLSVSFVPTDTTNYNAPVTSAAAITVTKATPTITWSYPADIVYGTALSATQLNATANVAGTFAYTPASSTILNAGAGQALSVSFIPTDTTNYTTPVTATAAITGTKATPTITWANPADITYGTLLSATQMNATANVAGTFTYTPASGTTLNAGAGQTLSVSFVPTDTTNYNTPVTATTAISVITNLNDARKAYLIALGLNSQPTLSDLTRYDVAPLDANGKPKGNGKIDIGDVVLMLRNVVGLVSW